MAVSSSAHKKNPDSGVQSQDLLQITLKRGIGGLRDDFKVARKLEKKLKSAILTCGGFSRKEFKKIN